MGIWLNQLRNQLIEDRRKLAHQAASSKDSERIDKLVLAHNAPAAVEAVIAEDPDAADKPSRSVYEDRGLIVL